MFGLDPSDKKAVGKYSLGMKQKLALSMAFLEDPKVLILDEPLSALDADSVQEARKRILEEKERGKLVLIASHYPEDIQSLCDKVYWMKNGHVLPSKENVRSEVPDTINSIDNKHNRERMNVQEVPDTINLEDKGRRVEK